MSLAFGLGAHYDISNEEQFWSELEDVLDNVDADTQLDGIDLAVKAYIAFAAEFYDAYLLHESDIERCIARLLGSMAIADHPDRCIHIIIEQLVTSLSPAVQHLCLCLLLRRGDTHPHTFRWLRKPRWQIPDAASVLAVCMTLVEQYGLQSVGTVADGDEEPHPAQDRLGVVSTQILYEICRVTRFDQAELDAFNAGFISHLFRLVEMTRDGDEQFNYSLARLIISLNEQFMVASVEGPQKTFAPVSPRKKSSKSLTSTNRVLEVLCEQLGALKTFGENLIFILNRLGSSSEDLCVSLLILKMLYLLFSTPATHEYFYTNDLCVLVDVFLRELSDLPEESEGLRHTYLRVLHPLLTNTQLREHPYKRHQIRRVLRSLIADEHIRDVSATTKRLAERNLRAEWCTELERNGVTLEDATKQASAAQIDAAQTSVAGVLPSIGRKTSSGSMGSNTSTRSLPSAAAVSILGGRVHAEPSMVSSFTSVADVAHTSTLGRIRRHTSSSSDLVASRPDSPSLASGPPSPTTGRKHVSELLSPLVDGDSLSPISRASSTNSPSGRRAPPLPPSASSRHAKASSAGSIAAPTAKQRRPPPPRPDAPLSKGLGIHTLAVT